MARIAIGGWQHETNTFATLRADYEAFAIADEWPPLESGQAMLDAVRGVHLPIDGAIRALEEDGHELVPLLWCSATPCSFVTEEAFERISAEMLGLLERSLPVDAIYLDLHGAMVCEHFEDGEGELLARIRELVGDEMPVFASLDLHANITPAMVENATVLDVYRTYPHIDMGQTGYRVARFLSQHLSSPRPLFKSWHQVEFLIPLNTGCTLIEPCQSIYASLPQHISDEVPSCHWPADSTFRILIMWGPALVGYGRTREAADKAIGSMAAIIREKQDEFHERIYPVQDCAQIAKNEFAIKGGTIVLADTQDNPGGGGSGDTTGLLQAMIAGGLENALLGVINDAEVATQSHEAGIGKRIQVSLGGKVGGPAAGPFQCEALVRNLSDGSFTATGPMYRGAHMQLGLTALLEISGILVAVCSKAVQTADQEHFRHLGVEPAEMDYVAVKSSVHFRNDYDELASAILIVASPGEVYADPAVLEYRNIRPEIEITRMS